MGPDAGPAEPDVPDAQLAEAYRLLRHEVAVVPVERQAILLAGPDAASYLQGQCSQDVEALGPGASADALLLSPQGKLDALVRVTRIADDRFVLDVDAGFADVVVARLRRFMLRVKADVEVLPWRCVALRGPAATATVAPGQVAAGTEIAAVVEWNGVAGVDLLGPAPVAPDGVPVAGPEAWRAVRVESGIPVMGAELDERTIAAEAGLVDRAVSFTKGCYTGQELVARIDSRGNRVARLLRGLVLQDVAGVPGWPGGPPGGPGDGLAAPHAGDAVVLDGRDVGRVTSVAWSPSLQGIVALAYVHRTVEPPAAVVVVRRTEEQPAASGPEPAVQPGATGGGARGDGSVEGAGSAVAWSGEVRSLPLVGRG